MKQILAEIQSGEFASEWIAENRAGGENFHRMRKEAAGHQIEEVGGDLRDDDALDRSGVLGLRSGQRGGVSVASPGICRIP